LQVTRTSLRETVSRLRTSVVVARSRRSGQREQQLVPQIFSAAFTTLAAWRIPRSGSRRVAATHFRSRFESFRHGRRRIHLGGRTGRTERKHLKIFVHSQLPPDLVSKLSLSDCLGRRNTRSGCGLRASKVFTELDAEAPMARTASIKHGFRSLIVVTRQD